MLAIITGTIEPAVQMSHLVLRDRQERLKQYADSIHFFLEKKIFSRIVFCENSNYGTEKLAYLKKLAEENGVALELLSFQGNSEKTCAHGKGYGEGEILEHVFKNSRIVCGEQYFVKITGRLKVDNIRDIVIRMKRNRIYFNIPNRTRRDIYDTRMYGMPVGVFREFFMKDYDRAMDDEGMMLEKLYTQILLERGIKVTNFPRYPRITGMSGSGGLDYSYTEWKCRVRDIMSQFNFYRVKKSAARG